LRLPISILLLFGVMPFFTDAQERNKDAYSDITIVDNVILIKHFLTDTNNIHALRPNLFFIGTQIKLRNTVVYVFGEILKGKSGDGYYVSTKGATKSNLVTIPFLQLHGSVMYDGFYESNIDTPYILKDIYQHTIHVALTGMIEGKYPIRIYFTTRFSNTSLLKNITDLNLQYNSQTFLSSLQSNINKWNAQQLSRMQDLNNLEALIAAKQKELSGLQGWLGSPSLTQQLVEEKEREMVQSRHLNSPQNTVSNYKDSLISAKIDSISRVLTKSISGKRNRCDSLIHEIALLQQKYDYERSLAGTKRDSLVNVLTHTKDISQLTSTISSMNLPDSVVPRGYRNLLAIRSFGIGRSMVNYSELTVKNISINGIQVEYNPSYYLAFAAGTVDYRFRDFILNDNAPQQQYVSVVRFGRGMRDGNHLIATYYAGKKALYNYSTDTIGNPLQNPPNYNIMGVSLESRYQLSTTTYVIAEVAKSSLPYYNAQLDKVGLFASTFRFKDHSNEAYSVQLVSYLPKTFTKITAYYKHFGANFQSFSLFTTSSAQNAWYLKAEQPFFKKKLDITASVRKNDFTNPYIDQAFYTNTIFKSIQATLRIKKWPVISLGYYPSSQLTYLGNGQYIENLFYTLVGTTSYFYRYHSVMMNTIISYTQFYNKATDSNFVYFNTRNLLVSQAFFLPKFTLQFNLSAAQNSAYDLYTADGNIQYKIRRWLTMGGGLKYIKQTVIENRQVGYSVNTTVKIPGFGDIQLLAQKGFIPGVDKQLVENDIGRLIYYRTF